MKRAIFFMVAVVRLAFTYEFTDQFPDEDDLLIDLVFSYPNREMQSMQEIVAADIMYMVALKACHHSSQMVVQPFSCWVAKTHRVYDPYQFRLMKVAKTDQGSVKRFWMKLKELSTKGITKEDFETAKKGLLDFLDKFRQQTGKIKQFLDQYRLILNELDQSTSNAYFKSVLAVNELNISYAINPVSLAYCHMAQAPRIILIDHTDGFKLELTEEDKANIYEIIHTMGTNGLFSLLKKKGHLQSLGKKINHVGPLQLLAYVFTEPTLKHDMKAVYSNNFKWSNFIDGLSKTLKRDWRTGIIKPQLSGFAQLVGKDPAVLEKHLERSEIDAFVKELL
ncbi:MAG: hypothetical protein HY860_07065 [Chlamydiales bacterium]|nr:hypothetical protein [Chlamydiales bacterium]